MKSLRKIELEEKSWWESKKIIFLGSFLLGTLVVLQIWANNTIVNYGDKFEEIRQRETNLRLENQILENEIATTLSLDNIASASSTLGLEPSKDVQYLH